MAPFNSNIPSQDAPNYFGYSQPISQPEPDKTSATIISGVSNLLDQGVKAVDFFIKDNIKGKVDAAADTLGGIFTAGLESTAGRDTEGTLVGKPDANAPFDVRNAGGSAGMLRSAAEAGKLSPTSYYGKLTQLAKDLRAQHPGYRDYIDAEISKATGIHPANAYMKSLMSDINESQSKLSSAQDKIDKRIYDDAPELYPAYVSGKIDASTALIKASERNAQKAELARNRALREDNTGSDNDRDVAARRELNLSSAYKAKNFVESMMIEAGAGHSMSIKQLNDGIANNTLKYDDTMMQALIPQIMAKKVEYLRQATADATSGKDPAITRLKGGTEDANKIINANAGVFDELINNIRNKEYGLAFHNANMFTARVNTASDKMLESKDIGFQMTQTAAIRKATGDQYLGSIAKYAIKTSFDKNFDTYYEDNLKKFIHQSDIKPNGDGTYTATPLPVPFTLKDAVDDGLKKGVNDARLYNNYVDFVTTLSSKDTTDPAKIALIKVGYSEGNIGVLNRFQNNGVDPQTKQLIVGKDTVFAQLTSKEALQTIKDMSDKYDKTLWPMAKNWAETEFSRELFTRDIQKMNTIQDDPNIKLTWNTQTSHWDVAPIGQRIFMQSSGLDAHVKDVKTVIDRINRGMDAIKNISLIEKGNTADADTYAISLLGQAGFNVKETMPGLPAKLAEAIRVAHTEPTFVERILGKTNERVLPNQGTARK